MTRRLSHAINAKGDGGIDIKTRRRNILAAPEAIAEFVLVHPFKGCSESRKPLCASFLFRQIHGLLLHRIHPRQPPDRLLVERHRRARLPRAVAQRAKFGDFRLYPGSIHGFVYARVTAISGLQAGSCSYRAASQTRMIGKMVGAAGFEPTTPSPPVKCATRLRYAPTCGGYTRRRGTAQLPFLGAKHEPPSLKPSGGAVRLFTTGRQRMRRGQS